MQNISEELRADSADVRSEWVRPEVRDMQAGDAEASGGAVVDGGAGLS